MRKLLQYMVVVLVVQIRYFNAIYVVFIIISGGAGGGCGFWRL